MSKKIVLDISMAIELYKSKSATEIARIFGVSRPTISARLREAGIPARVIDEQGPCVKCGSSERFKPKPGRRVGQCKVCHARYCALNREAIKEQKAGHYAENREMGIAKAAKWHSENRERSIASKARWYIKNQERIKAERVEYRLENLEAVRASNIKYKKENPAKANALSAKRRARKRNAKGSISAKEWVALVEYYGGLCLKCGAAEATMDHIIPLSCGGDHSIDNVQPLCRKCNSTKGTKTVDYRKVLVD